MSEPLLGSFSRGRSVISAVQLQKLHSDSQSGPGVGSCVFLVTVNVAKRVRGVQDCVRGGGADPCVRRIRRVGQVLQLRTQGGKLG